jgi:uncharacterized CHY-type Zn-finger protein
MSNRFGHYEHLVRVGALFAVGLAVFIGGRWMLIPPDFGVLGFYRAGALEDVKAQPLVYAGQQLCLDCHTDVREVRQQARHAGVACEACHGPLAKHASGDFEVRPRALNPRLLCGQCHTATPGRRPGFPQVVPADHAGDVPCTDCHKPHNPRID